MKTKENCNYCGEEYIPTRRGVQKFCCHSCRSKNHIEKNKNKRIIVKKSTENIAEIEKHKKNNKLEIEKMSASGIGNATTGALLASGITNLASNIFTPEKNKPATKGDIEELKNLINSRYFEVHNISSDATGRKAYFDMATSKIVYFDESQKKFILPFYDL